MPSKFSSIAFAIAFAGCAAIDAHADVLVMTDGRILRGEIVDETTRTLTFRFNLNGIWTTRTVERSHVESVYPEPGDQSDQAGEPESSPKDPTGPAAVPTSRPEADPTLPTVAVIPLHGVVGGTAGGQVRDTFDATVLNLCFEEALLNRADLVVLDIESPGGLVSEMEAVCESVLDWSDRLRIVGYPNEAYSAAAIITLCCKEVYVRPQSMIGAATIIQAGNGQLNALDAKFASPHYARQRQYMSRSGQPYEVVAAMTIQETRLWWSPSFGLTTSQPVDGTDFSEVDGASTILTMTADDAVKWKVAAGTATALEGVYLLTGVGREVNTLDLGPIIERHNRDLDRKLETLKNSITEYFNSLLALNQNMGDLFKSAQRGDSQIMNSLKRAVTREVGKIRNFGNQIETSDRSVLARRVEIPDDFLARIRQDRELLGRVGRLLNADNVDDWNEAAQRLNEVIRAWRDLLKDG